MSDSRYPARPKPLSLFARRQVKQAKAEERMKGILETILDIPIEDLPWPEIQELIKLDPNLTIEECMHLAQVRKALQGDTTAYKAVLDRGRGKIASKSIAVTTDYKTFLEHAMASEKEVAGFDADIPPGALVTVTTSTVDDDETDDDDFSDL